MTRHEGWASNGLGKRHYFLAARNTYPLCGRYLPAHIPRRLEDGDDHPDNCKACARALKKRQKAKDANAQP